MSVPVSQTPLVLLVGFLGAGKTTLLRRLIGEARAQWLTPHVILNDYANAQVDADDLRAELASVIPITGSCVCCSSQYELLAALAQHKHQARDVFIVETNGTTDAASLLAMLAASVRLEGFSAPVHFSVVDAKRWGRRWGGNQLETHQLRTASHVYFSRTDQVSKSRLQAVRASVANVNPAAEEVLPDAFLKQMVQVATGALAAAAALGEVPTPAEHHTHHFAALSLPIEGPVPKAAFLAFLNALPRQVVRAKGVIELVEAPGERRMFQKVEDEAELSPNPLKQTGAPAVLVLVGPRLDEGALRAQLRGLTRSP